MNAFSAQAARGVPSESWAAEGAAESAAPAIIKVDKLVKRYRGADRNAVDGVSLEVRSGEFFVLLGPNGAGKTTTISILTTTLAPTSGSITIAGFDVEREASAVRRSVGIIFQRPSLDLNLTAEENVRFHAVLYGLYPFRPAFRLMPRAYRHQVEQLAKILGIWDELFKPIRTFSGGMRRKLEIVRSLIHRPCVLFLDEPTVGLDPASRRGLWEYLRQVRSETSTTVFLTTHYLEEAEDADTVCIINRGRVVSYGAPDEVKSQLVQEYVLLDADDREGLASELLRRGIPFVALPSAPRFRVELGGRHLHQVLRSIETPLSVIKTHSPTLEDAYLHVVEPQEVAV